MRLVAMDLPGHGKSEHRPGKALYNFVDYIPDILSFIGGVLSSDEALSRHVLTDTRGVRLVSLADSLGWETFALLGHSLGAALATTMAGLFWKRVTHLIVVEGLGPWINPKNTNFVDEFNKAMFTNKVPHRPNECSCISVRIHSDRAFQGTSHLFRL